MRGLAVALAVVFACGGYSACRQAVLPSSEQVAAFGRRGSRPGELSLPRAVCATADGWLFVIDRSGRILRYTLRGDYDREWLLPAWENGTPTDMCAAPDGRLLVPDTHYHRILEYDFEGKLLRHWGEYGEEWGKFVYPTDVVVDRSGKYYVAEYGNASRVQVFDAERRFLYGWGSNGSAPGQFHRPMGIALTSRDELVVADAGNHRLQVFSLQGELVRVIGSRGYNPGEFIYPYDVCVDQRDRIIVCEYGAHRVQVFAPDGTWLYARGGPGSLVGQLANPWGVCWAPPDGIYLADYNNHRVQRWRLELADDTLAAAGS